MAKIQVVASATGFDGLVIRNKGDVFEMPEAAARKYASWFKPVDPKFKVEPKRERTPAGEVSDELAVLKAQVAQLTALLTPKHKQVETKKVEPVDEDLV